MGYFNKPSSELNLSEITFLCAIPNNPTLYDPRKNIENTINRRDRILDEMLEDGKITESQCMEAKTYPIVLDSIVFISLLVSCIGDDVYTMPSYL